MRTRLQEYRMLWRAAVTHANTRSTRFVGWFVLLGVVVLGAAVAAKSGARAALALFWCAAFVILLLNWGWRFMPGAVKLNHPANARLVPQMRPRLVELSCLVCCTGIAGIATAPFADTAGLGGALFWIVLLTVGTGLGAAGHRAGSTVLVAASFCAIFAGKLAASVSAMLSHPVVILLSLPLYAGVIVVAVRAMFPQGGEQHWKMEARRARWQEGGGKGDPFVERMAGVYTKGRYAASLRRDSSRRDGQRLLLHALGPTHHLGEGAAAIGLMAVVLGVLGVFMAWRIDAGVVRGIGWLFAAMLLFVPLSHSLRLGQLAVGRAAEQGLVRLAPALPAGAPAFNRLLGRALLLRALAGWGMASGAALVLVALGGAGAPELLRMAGICCLALPMVALPLRDHAAGRQLSGVPAVLLLLLCFVGCLVLAMVLAKATGLPAMALAALLGIGIAVLAVLRGLHVMAASPCAFPAGRID